MFRIANYLVYILLPWSCFCLNAVFCQNSCHANSLHNEPFVEAYRFDYINYTWPSQQAYQAAVQNGFNPRLQSAYNIKIYDGEIYLSQPRNPGSTIATLFSFPVSSKPLNPLVSPYPNWDANAYTNNCNGTIQNVLAFEIDSHGIMWIADGARRFNPTNCPTKILLLDVNNNGSLVQMYVLPEAISLTHGSWLNEVVVDETDGGFAYITDGGPEDPGIIVYSRRTNSAWKLRDRSMFAELCASNFRIHGVLITQLFNVLGIALSPIKEGNEKRIYYSAFTGYTLYSLSTSILKNETISSGANWRREIQEVGRKCSQGNGMIIDNRGNLYYGLIPADSIGRWNIYGGSFDKQSRVIYTNHTSIDSPDMFAMDLQGNLYVINPGTEKFFNPGHPFPPIRILRRHIGTKSYLYA